MYPGQSIETPRSTDEYAARIVKILENREDWEADSSRAVQVNSLQSLENFDRHFDVFLKQVEFCRPSAQKKVFTHLLRSQGLRAELYFSRWIEAKEKLKKETEGSS
jgi:hypothetical protein